MALYIPAARRRRNAFLLAGGALVLGLVLGWVVGRSQAPSVADRVATVQRDADDLVTRLGALPIEYEQGVAGQVDTVEEGVIAPLRGMQSELVRLLDRAPWIVRSGRDDALDALAAVKQAAEGHVAPDRFEEAVSGAQEDLRAALGRG